MKARIVFPEFNNPIIAEAAQRAGDEIEIVTAKDLAEACAKVTAGEADAMVAGIDYTSREVILACRDGIGVEGKTFSASFVMKRGDETLMIGDAAACKNPTEDQLFDIVLQTYQTARAVLSDEPRVAMLSFSTFGSGGEDDSIHRIKAVIDRVWRDHPEIKIDGEMQLDAAIVPRVAAKKAPDSLVAGKANVLILPDLNSGNILYKAMEQFGGF
ncbi:phosphate acetyltransferase, partial [Candidatus Saccharibacteria bacterium]|nr:phosphate acetyltransferase [Candidatus Saccharibacteria bacterium]